MTEFFPGAPRRPNPLGQGASFDAQALVQQTLARHGLDGLAAPSMPAMRRPSPEPALPPGAQFASGRFACTSGVRGYRLYVPAPARGNVRALVVMLHGCTQTPEDFATGTGMNALADRHGLIVAYPAQARGANAQSCWNWFSPGDQRRDHGEPAILAGLTRQIAAEHAIPEGRIFVAGLSAGGAMAAILGNAYADVFAGVGVHSGLPVGAARDVASAFAAMRGAPGQPAEPGSRNPVRTIVFHGSADTTVRPLNGERVAADALRRLPGSQIQTAASGIARGRAFQRHVTTGTGGRIHLEHWVIDGLGHAWSGGNGAGSHTDAAGPDASAEMVRFFLETLDESH